MAMSRKFKILFLVVFLVSLILRLGLTLVNREANDSHMEVVSIILKTNKLPTMKDCGECLQPKLFHYITVMVIEALGLACGYKHIVVGGTIDKFHCRNDHSGHCLDFSDKHPLQE